MAHTCSTCDGVGNLTAILDPSGEPSYCTYDELGRTLSAKNPLEETACFGYDEKGTETAIVVPRVLFHKYKK